MKMLFISLLFLLSSIVLSRTSSLISYAQATGRITVKVVDTTDGRNFPLSAASVQIVGTKLGALTKPDGSGQFPSVKEGVYTLVAKYVGFKADTVTGITVTSNNTTVVTFLFGIRIENILIKWGEKSPLENKIDSLKTLGIVIVSPGIVSQDQISVQQRKENSSIANEKWRIRNEEPSVRITPSKLHYLSEVVSEDSGTDSILAATGRIKVQLFDSRTKSPLIGAVIQNAEQHSIGAVSRDSGIAVINHLKPGIYSLLVKPSSYLSHQLASDTIKDIKVLAGQTVFLSFTFKDYIPIRRSEPPHHIGKVKEGTHPVKASDLEECSKQTIEGIKEAPCPIKDPDLEKKE